VSLPVVVSPQAEAAVTAAEARYESKQSGVGVTFRERVEEALDDIADQPGRFAPGIRNIRIAVVRGYQYLIIFREHRDHILVVAVVHSRSGSSYWLTPP
jgi:plasmid stabilization system protein ParE